MTSIIDGGLCHVKPGISQTTLFSFRNGLFSIKSVLKSNGGSAPIPVCDWLIITKVNTRTSNSKQEAIRELLVPLVTHEKMSFGKEMYPCLVFFVLGGIIIAIFIKILEWQSTAQQIHDYAEAGGEERILPIQEEGDESVLLHMGRVVQGYTIRPRKLPCQHEETH